MTKKTCIIGLALTAFVLVGGPADARLPEPYHVIWGTVSACGVDVPSGTVIELHAAGEPDPLVSYALGSDPTLGNLAALRVPLDAVDPQDPGTLRPGAEVEIFIRDHGVENCPELAGVTDVGERGTFQRLDIDPNLVASLPSVNITDGSVVEGDAGTVLLTFDIFLSEESENAVDVSWVTDDDNPDATATPNDDYVPEADTVTINPGDLSVTIDVEVVGEEVEEADEVFFVQLVSTNGEANILDNLGRGTILDDDTPPTIAINNVTVREPPFDSVDAVFRISLSHEWEAPVSVDFATAPDSATANVDYLSISGTATIPAGQLSTTVEVEVLFDDTDEDDETFFVNLSNPVNGTILDGEGQGTIVDIVQFLIYIEQLVDGVGPVDGIAGAWAVTVSPDGEHVYAASRATDSIVLFERDLVSGELSCPPGGCLRYQDGVDGVDGLDGVEDLVVSSDGLNLYAASYEEAALAVFSRDPADGSLLLLEVERDGIDDQSDVGAAVDGLAGAAAIGLSPGPLNEHVYVAGYLDNAVAVFARDADDSADPNHGKLSFLEVEIEGQDDATDLGGTVVGIDGASSVVVHPGGDSVYVTGFLDDAVAVFDRESDDTSGNFGRLSYKEFHTDGANSVDGLWGPVAGSISPDGAHLYVAGQADDGIAIFDIAGDGTLGFRSSVLDGIGGAEGLGGISDVQVSYDGEIVYTSAFLDDAVTAYRRDTDPGSATYGELTLLEVKWDETGGVDGLDGANGLAVSPLDLNVYVASVVDSAIAVFARDLQEPTDPTSVDASHPVSDWSNDPVITVEWSGAVDNAGGSGVAGYSFLFDDQPTTLPDEDLDLFHTTDPHSTSSAPLADGRPYYFHLRTCDWSENCTTTVHLGPFWIDATLPNDPTNVASTSHTPGVPDPVLDVISMSWDPAIDPGVDPSGVVGYAYGFDGSPDTLCDPQSDPIEVTTSVDSAPLANGTWYFHVCTVDDAGNGSATVTTGPYILDQDTVPPEVATLDGVPKAPEKLGYPDGLPNGVEVPLTPTQLLVTFDESMDPATATNTANYFLVSAGPDETLDTVDCTGVVGDDVAIAIDGAVYDDPSWTAAIQLNGGVPLGEDLYRVFACSGLADVIGNPLDGDGDGTGGDDFASDFTLTITNLLENPNLDEDIASWLIEAPGPSDFVWDNSDADGVPWTSGSAFLSNVTGQEEAFAISQCIVIDPGLEGLRYYLEGRPVIEKTTAGDPVVFGSATFFEDPNCIGTELGASSTSALVGDTSENCVDWKRFLGHGIVPVGSSSALVSFVASIGPHPDFGFDASFDSLLFAVPNVFPVFMDDFETGTFCAWSDVEP